MKKLITLTFAFAAILSLGMAADEKKAEGKKGKGDPAAAFKKLDTNGDGKVSKEEYLASPMAAKAKEKGADPEKGFTAKDKDKDGNLSMEEFAAKPEKKPK